VPVTEHPIFPGSSAALSLTKDQYDVSLYLIKHVSRNSKRQRSYSLVL
jgi:hypothetical protein